MKEFLREFNRTSILNRWPEDYKVKAVVNYLDRKTRKWFEAQNLYDKDWDTFEREFLEEYQSPDAEYNALERFHRAKQEEGETASEFYYRVLELAKLTECVIPHKEYIRVFKTGLRDRLYRIASCRSHHFRSSKE